MAWGWYFDWTTFWILLGLTLWEGVRRVPAGAFLLRSAVGYPWHVARGPYAAGGWRLVSWLSPFVCHVLLTPATADGRAPHPHLRRWAAVLRVPGAVAFAALVIGVPLLTANGGFRGLLQALGAAFGASVVAAAGSGVALWRMRVPVRTALQDVLPMLSPFTAPRAPEIVLARVLEGVALVDAVRAMLPADAYAEWLRPVAYDAARGQGDLLPAAEAAAVLRHPPPGLLAGDVYCARCGRVYLADAPACRMCEDVEMVRVPG